MIKAKQLTAMSWIYSGDSAGYVNLTKHVISIALATLGLLIHKHASGGGYF